MRQGLVTSENEATEKIEEAIQPEASVDSMLMLEQQQNAGSGLDVFTPIQFDDLEELPIQSIDQNMANDIYREDRKSTRLNSSHVKISYAVFCLKKKMMHII